MIEKEIKAMLTGEEYDGIARLFPWDSKIPQTNHYYTDNDGTLKKNGITFRVRTIEGKSIIQVKKHINKNSALQISEEKEFPIDILPKSFTENEIEAMTSIKSAVSYIGDLTTLRYSFMFSDGVEICLDKNDYLDRTDYEIEIEYTSPIPDELLEILEKVGVRFDKPARGKFSRFMTRLAEILQ